MALRPPLKSVTPYPGLPPGSCTHARRLGWPKGLLQGGSVPLPVRSAARVYQIHGFGILYCRRPSYASVCLPCFRGSGDTRGRGIPGVLVSLVACHRLTLLSSSPFSHPHPIHLHPHPVHTVTFPSMAELDPKDNATELTSGDMR